MDYDTNTTAIYTLMYYRGARIVKGMQLKRYVLSMMRGEQDIIPLNGTGSTATTKPMTTEHFDPFRGVVYYATNAAVAIDSEVAMSTMYYQSGSIDLRYSFNCGQTLTTKKEVYLVMQKQSDGLCAIASTPWSQTLPTTNDGKLYMLLGMTYSTYQIELWPKHPIYYHDGTALRQYSGDYIPPAGLTNYNFHHAANSVVNTPTVTITFAANRRDTQMITVSDDIGISIGCLNSADNYLWVANSGAADIDVTFNNIIYGVTPVTNVYMPDGGITVPAGKVAEIGIVCNTDGCFITARCDLSL